MVILSGILGAWREVKGIVIALCSLGLLAFISRRRGLGTLAVLLLGWVFYFFRDPDRSPIVSPAQILAPADGMVTDIEIVEEPYFFKGQAQRVSVFLSLFDVHVQRIPYRGTVEFLHYQPGDFAPAFLKNTHGNEFNYLGLSTGHGPIGVKQIAGILARRIICWPTGGDEMERGERFGLIKFGSRVDLLLPIEAQVLVEVGQKVAGGYTIIGAWPD